MADAVSSQGEGQILTTVLPMQRLVVCDPLQIVALKQRCADCTASSSVRGKTVQAAGPLLLLCNASCLQLAARSGYYIAQLYCFATNLRFSRVSIPMSFEANTPHKCSLCFRLGLAATVASALTVPN